MRKYVVRQGDYMRKIANFVGFDPEVVWNSEENGALRRVRGDGNILQPGDVLHVPDAIPEGRPVQVHTTNQFVARRPTARAKVRFLLAGKPLANAPYVASCEGREQRGTTDDHGTVSLEAPLTSCFATVFFVTQNVHFDVRIGGLDPHDGDSGLLQRMTHLGYMSPGDDLSDAVSRFQEARGLPATGRVDGDTRDALIDAHGC